jgi:NAD+ synthase
VIERSAVADRLRLNAELACAALTAFIRDAVETTGTQGVVVGLSGGIDSALAAGLAVRALGPERVLALLLPYRTSSPDSAADAEAVAQAFGIDAGRCDISPMVDAYFAGREEGGADRVRRGNLMSRIRMAVLFDHAKARGALVLGTSNKTEILLGYSTLFGDNASSINPLGDLYKCQVVQLARHIGVPEAVVTKKPSADLWPGQTDEGELGFGYDLADEVLYLMFNRAFEPEEVMELGYPEAVVRRIDELERTFRYKRRLMLIARLSGSAINLDREIPRD